MMYEEPLLTDYIDDRYYTSSLFKILREVITVIKFAVFRLNILNPDFIGREQDFVHILIVT
jgi:hypothetical protein